VTGLGVFRLAGSGSSRVRSGNLRLAGVAGLAGGRLRVVLGLRLGDCARAVGDGEGGGLSDGVSLVAVSKSGGLRAVGGDGSHDLGGVLSTVTVGGVVRRGIGSSDEEASSSSSLEERHFDGCFWRVVLEWSDF
jgi:hypothetical protein